MITDSRIPLYVVYFCAEECKKQESGELSVARMCEAWLALCGCGKDVDWSATLISIGILIEQEKNRYGFRCQPVTIKGEVIPVLSSFYDKVTQITQYALCGEISPAEWYQEFEAIHPFNDGNGRIGALMFNYLSGTMLEPKPPPEFMKIPEI